MTIPLRWLKTALLAAAWLLGAECVPAGAQTPDSIVRLVCRYAKENTTSLKGEEQNVYVKYDFRTMRRNPTLILVPTMYAIARGTRNYTGETYGRILFKEGGDYEIKPQIAVGTISSYRKIMPHLVKLLTPDIYGVTLLGQYMLSPFHPDNTRFYRYRIVRSGTGLALTLRFDPKTDNTQLVKGTAEVDPATGRILSARIYGTYDLTSFKCDVTMGEGSFARFPKRCEVLSNFRFLGNKIGSKILARFGLPETLTDTIAATERKELMQRLRPEPLTKFELEVYEEQERKQALRDTTDSGKPRSQLSRIRETAWDIVGDHLLSSTSAESGKASISLSPLFNPMSFSYSRKHGVAYRMDIGAAYDFNSTQSLSLRPRIGYNFKHKQLYYSAPLRFTFNSRRDAWVEYQWANGNRIASSAVLDKIQSERLDTIDFGALQLDYFNDESYQIMMNYRFSPQWNVNFGTVYHRREAVNREVVVSLGNQPVYRSFAPTITLSYQPSPLWPLLKLNYERGISNVFKSNIRYERWETDAIYRKRLKGLQQYCIRLGSGLYTDKQTDYFVDYRNFHENYLPESWEDDWSGNFQLLNSSWYNASRYYIRANLTYESPLMALTRTPFIGRLIEMERIYVNILQIQHISTPYIETGYGFTNRYCSFGMFASFVNANFKEIGGKFTIGLFKNW